MNTFGSTSWQCPLYDPRGVTEDRERFNRDRVPELSLTNCLHVPTGVTPTRGYLLIAREDYDHLDRYSTSLTLDLGDPRQSDNVGTIRGLSIVQARCVTRGLATDPHALYLVEVTDARGLLHNEWYSHPLTAAYNVRVPAYPDSFLLSSMAPYPTAGADARTTWTWSTMLRDVWERMPLLGTWPGLPYAPTGTPEGFWFTGVPAWPVLCDLLANVGMVVAVDPTSASPYTIVDDGAADSALAALQARYVTHLVDDAEWIDVGAGRVPGSVVVHFRRRYAYYGAEETVTYGPRAWASGAVHTVTVTAPAAFTGAVGTHHIWSDFTVRVDQNGDANTTDLATAATIAAERVEQYFDRIYSGTYGHMSQTYAGALPFSTGSQVDSVYWHMDHRHPQHGWSTAIQRGDTCGLLPQGRYGD